MAGILTKKSCFFAVQLYVCILLGASLLCERTSALEIHTNKTVVLWLGEEGQSLPCDVRLSVGERIAGLSWTKANLDNVIVKIFRGNVMGPGFDSGDFSLSENKSLIFNKNAQISDEGEYFCTVTISGATSQHHNSSTIRVLSAPREPFPTIAECTNTERDIHEPCLLKFEPGKSVNLTCDVSGFRPLVTLEWSNQTQTMDNVYMTLIKNSDGSQNLSATFEVTANLERQEFVCNVSGETVLGHRWTTVIIQGFEDKVNVVPPTPVAAIVVGIFVVLILVIIVGVICLLWKKNKLPMCVRTRSNGDQETDSKSGAVSMTVTHTVDETQSREATETDIQDHMEEENANIEEDEEQTQELLTEEEREAYSDFEFPESDGEPSRQPSMSSLQRLEFESSWVCVQRDDVSRRGTNNEETQAAPLQQRPPQQRPPRQGALSSVVHGVGNILNTLHEVLRHEA